MIQIDPTIPFEELPFHLNLKCDDLVFVSSDLKNFALNAKKQQKSLNIDLFIENFQQVLTKGTLIIPAYTDYLKNGDTFDFQKSKPSTGAISNKVFKRKDFIRTNDPLHSVLIWGKHQNEILDLKDESTFGKDTIFGFMHRQNGVFLFFDVHIENSFTFIHYIEEYLNVPYRKYYKPVINVIKDGKKIAKTILFHTKKLGVMTDFEDLNNTLILSKSMLQFQHNHISINSISALETVSIVEQKIANKNYLYHFSFKEFIKKIIKIIIKK